MVDVLDLDYETKSTVNLKQVGLGRYVAPDSQTSVLMASYSFNHGPVRQWRITDGKFPAELTEALLDPDVEKWGFNSQFERVVTRDVLGINTPYKGWRCAQVLAYMHSFMGGLEDISANIGLALDLQKMKRGDELIAVFCMPQRQTRHNEFEWRNWLTDPELWEEFCEYNIQDTITETAVKTRLKPFPIPDIEWQYYEMDQEINDRGMPLDLVFINQINRMAARRKDELVHMMNQITGLHNSNSGPQLLPWLLERGYPWDNLRKENVAVALKRDGEWWRPPERGTTEEAIAVLKLRQWAARTSTGKAEKALICKSPDNRARYLYQFVGAGRTGRESGRLIQPQNLVRTPGMLDVDDHGPVPLEVVTDTIRQGDYDGLDLLVGEVMLGLTGCMRSMFRAGDDEELMSADLASIESAGLGYLSRCKRLLNVFRTGRDPYKDFGQEFYRKAYDAITKAERQICKPPALGCGYRLSAGFELPDGTKTGLLAYAEGMGIEMTLEQAQRAVTIYRETYPEVAQFWKDLEIAAYACVTTHMPQKVGYLQFEWNRPYLLLRLPSGRCIYYYRPRIETREIHTGRMKKIRSEGFFEHGAEKGEWVEVEDIWYRPTLTYWGRDHKTSKWRRLDSHGGLMCENAVQAFTRDILFTALHRLHLDGWPLIGHAHDEGIALVRKGSNRFTLERMIEVFKQPIAWAPGMPLGAAGWSGPFYRK